MELCGRAGCIYAAVEKMIYKMKKEVAERRNIPDVDLIVVAKIYHVTAAVLAEACRRNFGIDEKNCEPSKEFKRDQLTLDTFILLNQLKEEGFIEPEYKQAIFDALIEIKPEMKKLVGGGGARGLI